MNIHSCDIAESVLESVSATVGLVEPGTIHTVGGGSISRSYRLSNSEGEAFLLKTNAKSALDMFEAEREGLLALRDAAAIRVPEPILVGARDDTSFLLMEHIEFGPKTAAATTACGHALAMLHRQTQPRFGWHRDNTIGSTPQENRWSDDWLAFFRDARLGYQLRLAHRNGIDASILASGRKLLERLPQFFADYAPVASLLHGDLWGGNWGATHADAPVIYDPATYFGDRETDIAMTKLFGGFGAGFYAAYNESWPLDVGFGRRCDLYNLYHVLNHYNLFGGGYQQQTATVLARLLA